MERLSGGQRDDASAAEGNQDPAGLAIFTVTADGRVTGWSEAAGRLFGRTAAQTVGRHARSLLPRGEHDGLAAAFAAIAGGRGWSGTVPMTCAGGRQDVSTRWTPLQTAPGAARQAAVVASRAHPARGAASAPGMVQLGATLDLAETARQVIDLAVPQLGDSAAVYVTEPLLTVGRPGDPAVASDTVASDTVAGDTVAGDTVAGDAVASDAVARRLAVGFAALGPDAAGGRAALLRDDWLRALPDEEVVVFASGTPVARCLADGQVVCYNHPDQGMIDRINRHPDGGELVAGLASFLAAPMTARGEATGVLMLARRSGRAPFDAHDAAAAQSLAARAAVCVDNARLFTQTRRIADVLQRNLLPQEFSTPAGVEIAHRYQPAGDHLVGGDWYDVITLDGGRIVLTVGDAMGHGPDAAAVMVQLRAATHVLADLGLAPDELLRRLNRMVSGITNATFATCVCAALDPATGRCTIARAGHLPPLVAFPGGDATLVSLPSGLPLGLGEADFRSATVTLPPGALLALYTDGLVENRRRTFDEGIAALRSALAAATGPLSDACGAVVETLRDHGEDDTTLVLARMPARATGGRPSPPAGSGRGD